MQRHDITYLIDIDPAQLPKHFIAEQETVYSVEIVEDELQVRGFGSDLILFFNNPLNLRSMSISSPNAHVTLQGNIDEKDLRKIHAVDVKELSLKGRVNASPAPLIEIKGHDGSSVFNVDRNVLRDVNDSGGILSFEVSTLTIYSSCGVYSDKEIRFSGGYVWNGGDLKTNQTYQGLDDKGKVNEFPGKIAFFLDGIFFHGFSRWEDFSLTNISQRANLETNIVDVTACAYPRFASRITAIREITKGPIRLGAGNILRISNSDYANSIVLELLSLDLPNFEDIINDVKKIMKNIFEFNLSNLTKSGSAEISFNSVYSFCNWIIKKFVPALGALFDTIYAGINLIINSGELFDYALNLIKNYKTVRLANIWYLLGLINKALALGQNFISSAYSSRRTLDTIIPQLQGKWDVIKRGHSPIQLPSGKQVLATFGNIPSLMGGTASSSALLSVDTGQFHLKTNHSRRSVYEVRLGSSTVGFTESSSAYYSSQVRTTDIAVSVSEQNYYQKVHDKTIIADSVFENTYESNWDASCSVVARTFYCKQPVIVIEDFFSEQGRYQGIHAQTLSADVEQDVVIDNPINCKGRNVSVTTTAADGITVIEPIQNAESVTLNAPQGQLDIEAPIESKLDNNLIGRSIKTDAPTKNETHTEPFMNGFAVGDPFTLTTSSTTQPPISITSKEGDNNILSGGDIDMKATDLSAGKNNNVLADGRLSMDGQKTVTTKSFSFLPDKVSRKEKTDLVHVHAGETNNLISKKDDVNLTYVETDGTKTLVDAGRDANILNSNILGNLISQVTAGHDASLTDSKMNADKTRVVAGRDAKALASNINGRFKSDFLAKRDAEVKCRKKLKPNPLGGTIAKFEESNVTSTDGEATVHGGRFGYVDGNVIGKKKVDVEGDEGLTVTALTHPYVAERKHHTSFFGLVKKDSVTTSEQVDRPVILSETEEATVLSKNGKTNLKGVLLPTLQGTHVHGDKGVVNDPVIVTTQTHSSTRILGGWLYKSDEIKNDEKDIPTEVYTEKESEFSANQNGIYLRSINFWGDGNVNFNAPGQTVELSRPILNHSFKKKVRGFGASLEVPILSEVKDLVNDAKHALGSVSPAEALMNATTLGVHSVNSYSSGKKTSQNFSSFRDIPIYAHFSYGEENTEMHEQTVGQGECHLHRFEVHADKFNLLNGYSVNADQAVIDAKEINFTGAKLESTLQQENTNIGVDISLNGITGGDISYNTTNMHSTYYQPSEFKAKDLEIKNAEQLNLSNANLKTSTMRGTVGEVNVESKADQLDQASIGGNIGTSGVGFSRSKLDIASTQASHFESQDASGLTVGAVNTQGGTFSAPDAKIDSMTDTPVYDHSKEKSIAVQYHVFESDDAPISVPVSAQYQKDYYEAKQDAKGTHVLKDKHVDYNAVVPVFHSGEPSTKLVLPEVSSESLDTDEKQNSLTQKKVEDPIISEKPSNEETHSKLPIQQAYDELFATGKSWLSFFYNEGGRAVEQERMKAQGYVAYVENRSADTSQMTEQEKALFYEGYEHARADTETLNAYLSLAPTGQFSQEAKIAGKIITNLATKEISGEVKHFISRDLDDSVGAMKTRLPGELDDLTRKIESYNLPTKGEFIYYPPKNYHPTNPLPKGPNHGYIDRYGNEWVKGRPVSYTDGNKPFEWDIQLSKLGKERFQKFTRDGQHVNTSQNGSITHNKRIPK